MDPVKRAELNRVSQGGRIGETYRNHGQGQRPPAGGTVHPCAALVLTDDVNDLPDGIRVYRNTDAQLAIQYVYDANGEPLASTNPDYMAARDYIRSYEKLV